MAVFTSWILSRILCVLAEADCSLLHDKSISAILSLLQVRGYGVWFFSLIAIVHVWTCAWTTVLKTESIPDTPHLYMYSKYFIIRLAPWAGKMNRNSRCDWLPERARWSYFVSVHKHAKEELGQYPAILTWHLVNNPFISPNDFSTSSNLQFHHRKWKSLGLFLSSMHLVLK